MRILLLLLVFANLLALSWWQGWLDSIVGGVREPARLERQIEADRLRVLGPGEPDTAAEGGSQAAMGGESRSPERASEPTAAAVEAPPAAAPVPAPNRKPAVAVAPKPEPKPTPEAKPNKPRPEAKPAGAPAPSPPSAESSPSAAPQVDAPTAPSDGAGASAAAAAAAPQGTGESTPAQAAQAVSAAPAPAPAPKTGGDGLWPSLFGRPKPAEVCFDLAGVDEARGAALRARLEALGARVEQTATDNKSGYVVYIKPYATLAEARERIAQLREQGVRDIYLIQDGSYRLAISLGVFRTMDSVEVLLGRLRARGVEDAQVGFVNPTATRITLRVRGPEDKVGEAVLRPIASAQGAALSACP